MMPDTPHPDIARLGFRPGMVMRAFGMRRSGNHAIAGWLLKNAANGRSLFLNNCRPGHNPLTGFRSIEVNGQPSPVRSARKKFAQTVSAAGSEALVLVSYEDTLPSADVTRPVSGDFDETLIGANLIIYRSFLNWTASLLKKLQANPGYNLAWRASVMMRAIDTYAGLLALVQSRGELRLTCICYDRWVISENCRSDILTDLGLPVRDNTLGPLRGEGGGSSFQKGVTDAAELTVSDRSAQMAQDPEYLAILHLAARDHRLVRLLREVFPDDAARLARLAVHSLSPRGVL